jgi:energy-coupling factor transporter ATP-binding protein EcfA2
VPEDRLSEGLFLDKPIRDNIVTAVLNRLRGRFGALDARNARRWPNAPCADLQIATPDVDRPVQSLSGGNQQRVLIGRWLAIGPRVLILHGPTVGVDVGSKDTIYRIVQRLAEQGLGVILVSDDLQELLQNCDRILLMRKGRIANDFDAQGWPRASCTTRWFPTAHLPHSHDGFHHASDHHRRRRPSPPEVGRPPPGAAWLAQRPSVFTLALIVLVCLVVGAINRVSSSCRCCSTSCAPARCWACSRWACWSCWRRAASTCRSRPLPRSRCTASPSRVELRFRTRHCAAAGGGRAGGAVLGVLNGLLVHWLKAPSLIVTIGTQYLYRGILLTFVGTVFFMNIPRQHGRLRPHSAVGASTRRRACTWCCRCRCWRWPARRCSRGGC